ncbi:MAG: putative Phenmedipham hydrolase [Amycolatopsis sp.]|uniref:carboxylesterase/lipase family protein n=1 Tax=Amycolatopsis sp. TaxID=37632 RepID=UPI00262B7096|nr:carboxylesterase family protein [Amycolatopsis sp.]MCU1682022.1 putative Phenmedipham hydrolase [Amycolatopsis sp.]
MREEAPDDLTVTTAAGRLRGRRGDRVRTFQGVPFAAPPVGALRFRPPAPVPAWTGVRSAERPGPASYQFNAVNESSVRKLAETIDPGVPGIMAWPDYANTTYRHDNAAEDCLYLDLWVPDHEPGAKLPVYVYYHGGANAVSSGSFPLERGENLAREQHIIVVRPNYRLGALGWVHFGLLGDDLAEAVNLGFQDQKAALEWVHATIAAFGGDPANLTIGGESAGATAVSHLLTNPDTRGLVRRAVIQSLSPFNPWCTQQRPDAEAVARQYLDLLGMTTPAELLDVDPDRLLAVQNVLGRWFEPDANLAWRPLGGVVDGHLIPELPALALSGKDVPAGDELEVMIGFAKDEWTFFRGHSDTVRSGSAEDVLAVLEQVFGVEAAGVYRSYEDLHPAHAPGHLLADVMSMEFFKFSALAIADRLDAAGTTTYVFEFAYELPGLGGDLRAVHTGDIPFLFGNQTDEDLARWPAFDGIDRAELDRVSRAMRDLYGAFIRTGEPGRTWPRYRRDQQAVLWFGREIAARPGLLSAERGVFEDGGVLDVAQLEDVLVRNLRARRQPQPIRRPVWTTTP